MNCPGRAWTRWCSRAATGWAGTPPATLAGVPIDLGASFVGPTQDAVLKLAADLGCDTTPTYNAGVNLIRWRGTVRRYQGTIPKLGLLGLVDIGRVQWQFERIAKGSASPNRGRRRRRRSWTPSAWAAG